MDPQKPKKPDVNKLSRASEEFLRSRPTSPSPNDLPTQFRNSNIFLSVYPSRTNSVTNLAQPYQVNDRSFHETTTFEDAPNKSRSRSIQPPLVIVNDEQISDRKYLDPPSIVPSRRGSYVRQNTNRPNNKLDSNKELEEPAVNMSFGRSPSNRISFSDEITVASSNNADEEIKVESLQPLPQEFHDDSEALINLEENGKVQEKGLISILKSEGLERPDDQACEDNETLLTTECYLPPQNDICSNPPMIPNNECVAPPKAPPPDSCGAIILGKLEKEQLTVAGSHLLEMGKKVLESVSFLDSMFKDGNDPFAALADRFKFNDTCPCATADVQNNAAYSHLKLLNSLCCKNSCSIPKNSEVR